MGCAASTAIFVLHIKKGDEKTGDFSEFGLWLIYQIHNWGKKKNETLRDIDIKVKSFYYTVELNDD